VAGVVAVLGTEVAGSEVLEAGVDAGVEDGVELVGGEPATKRRVERSRKVATANTTPTKVAAAARAVSARARNERRRRAWAARVSCLTDRVTAGLR
jgi:hypothetical protein